MVSWNPFQHVGSEGCLDPGILTCNDGTNVHFATSKQQNCYIQTSIANRDLKAHKAYPYTVGYSLLQTAERYNCLLVDGRVPSLTEI